MSKSFSASCISPVASSCAPRRKCSAATLSLEWGQKRAAATTLTVFASRHTCFRYNSIIARSENLAATAESPSSILMIKFCSWRLSLSSRCFWLMVLMSVITCEYSLSRSALSRQRKRRKQRWRRVSAGIMPRLRSSTSA